MLERLARRRITEMEAKGVAFDALWPGTLIELSLLRSEESSLVRLQLLYCSILIIWMSRRFLMDVEECHKRFTELTPPSLPGHGRRAAHCDPFRFRYKTLTSNARSLPCCRQLYTYIFQAPYPLPRPTPASRSSLGLLPKCGSARLQASSLFTSPKFSEDIPNHAP